MTSLSETVSPKSEQLTADDLQAGPRVITIRDVSGTGNKDQPIDIWFNGDEGKPFKPCKTVRRVLLFCWGDDGKAFIGRSMRLYRDERVKFGGLAVGGIRVSHLSHIERKMAAPVQVAKGAKAAYEVLPLEQPAPQKTRQTAEEWAAEHIAAVEGVDTLEALDALQKGAEKAMGKLATGKPELHTQVMMAYATKLDALSIPDDEGGDMHDADGVVVEDEV